MNTHKITNQQSISEASINDFIENFPAMLITGICVIAFKIFQKLQEFAEALFLTKEKKPILTNKKPTNLTNSIYLKNLKDLTKFADIHLNKIPDMKDAKVVVIGRDKNDNNHDLLYHQVITKLSREGDFVLIPQIPYKENGYNESEIIFGKNKLIINGCGHEIKPIKIDPALRDSFYKINSVIVTEPFQKEKDESVNTQRILEVDPRGYDMCNIFKLELDIIKYERNVDEKKEKAMVNTIESLMKKYPHKKIFILSSNKNVLSSKVSNLKIVPFNIFAKMPHIQGVAISLKSKKNEDYIKSLQEELESEKNCNDALTKINQFNQLNGA